LETAVNSKVNPNITDEHPTAAMQMNTGFYLILRIRNFLINFQFTFYL